MFPLLFFLLNWWEKEISKCIKKQKRWKNKFLFRFSKVLEIACFYCLQLTGEKNTNIFFVPLFFFKKTQWGETKKVVGREKKKREKQKTRERKTWTNIFYNWSITREKFVSMKKKNTSIFFFGGERKNIEKRQVLFTEKKTREKNKKNNLGETRWRFLQNRLFLSFFFKQFFFSV